MALQRHGVEVDGEALDVDSLPAREKLPPGGDLRALVRHRSQPLSAIGAAMLKASRNLYAESWCAHLGLVTGPGAYAGRSLVVDALAGWASTSAVRWSRTGRDCRATPTWPARALVEVLARMSQDPSRGTVAGAEHARRAAGSRGRER